MSLKTEAFGKFILLDKIAMGGMAEVWRAKTFGAEGIGKIVAIKRILPQFSSNHEFIEMFKEEAKITVNLNHANIVPIYEFGEEQGQFFLVMDYVDGRNLRQILSRCSKHQKALTVEQCVYTIAQVAVGLDYAHRCTDKNTGKSLNIIHRDMSPQNIMISFEGEIKIVDFGIAKAETKIETTRAGTLKGKFGYMSPEQAEGMDLDARTDIFSTGIVLWELLSGERLFVANNEMNTIRKIRDCQIPSLRKINPNIHEELERITHKALTKDRGLRYQTGAELYKDLSRFLYKINPEFTPHELTSFIKTLFKEEILEDRKLVADFAKVKAPSQHRTDEKTQVVVENTKTVTETSDEMPVNLLVNEQSLNKSVDLSLKMDRVEILRKAVASSNNSQSFKTHTHTPIRPLGSTSTGIRAPQKRRSSGGALVPLFFTGLIVAGAYWFWKSNPQVHSATFSSIVDKIKGKSNIEAAPEEQPLPQQPIAAIDTNPKVPVWVTSAPATAEIVMDGKVVGTTPMEIQVPFQKQVEITLQKDRYAPATKRYIATNTIKGDPISVVLNELKNTAYISIETIPAGSSIFLNGVKLSRKSPIKRYPVQAGQISVRAVNELTNAVDQKTVAVRENQDIQVQLIPGRK